MSRLMSLECGKKAIEAQKLLCKSRNLAYKHYIEGALVWLSNVDFWYLETKNYQDYFYENGENGFNFAHFAILKTISKREGKSFGVKFCLRRSAYFLGEN